MTEEVFEKHIDDLMLEVYQTKFGRHLAHEIMVDLVELRNLVKGIWVRGYNQCSEDTDELILAQVSTFSPYLREKIENELTKN